MVNTNGKNGNTNGKRSAHVTLTMQY